MDAVAERALVVDARRMVDDAGGAEHRVGSDDGARQHLGAGAELALSHTEASG